jgi:hypothetical protein
MQQTTRCKQQRASTVVFSALRITTQRCATVVQRIWSRVFDMASGDEIADPNNARLLYASARLVLKGR